MTTSKIIDKNGREVKNYDFVKWGGSPDNCSYAIAYDLEGGGTMLGEDSTNLRWIWDGRAYPGQYGMYELTQEEIEGCEVIDFEEYCKSKGW